MSVSNQIKNQRGSILYPQLEMKVLQWANERKLLKPRNSKQQLLKTMAELGELADAEAKDDKEEIIDGLGDVVVTLIIYAQQKGLDLTECLESAYNEIKDRTGKTVDGTFIKDT